MKICHAAEEHLDGIIHIENVSFSCPWSKQSFLDAIKNENMIVLVSENDDGHPVGFLCALIIGDEAELLDIAVLPEYRKNGVANSLFHTLLSEQKMEPASKIFLEVRLSNVPARTFYEKLGFTQIGVRRNYYRNPTEDAILMVKTLQD